MRPRIFTAKNSGFCFGVRRAIDIAEKTVGGRKKIYTLGPLIHNPQEVKRLEGIGIRKVEDPRKLKNAVLILRTHGIPQGLKRKLKSQNLLLVDATCPFVKRAQDIVERLARKKKKILIVGERRHPEVKALVSYGGKKCFVVERNADLESIDLLGDVCIVSQTTQAPENFALLVSAIRSINPRVSVFNTICRATVDRQTAAKELSDRVDAMIVVGGKNSGNTRRLAEICSKYTTTHHIETASELKNRWFKKASRVGLSAGASTPAWIIAQTKKKIEDMLKSRDLKSGRGAGHG